MRNGSEGFNDLFVKMAAEASASSAMTSHFNQLGWSFFPRIRLPFEQIQLYDFNDLVSMYKGYVQAQKEVEERMRLVDSREVRQKYITLHKQLYGSDSSNSIDDAPWPVFLKSRSVFAFYRDYDEQFDEQFDRINYLVNNLFEHYDPLEFKHFVFNIVMGFSNLFTAEEYSRYYRSLDPNIGMEILATYTDRDKFDNAIIRASYMQLVMIEERARFNAESDIVERRMNGVRCVIEFLEVAKSKYEIAILEAEYEPSYVHKFDKEERLLAGIDNGIFVSFAKNYMEAYTRHVLRPDRDRSSFYKALTNSLYTPTLIPKDDLNSLYDVISTYEGFRGFYRLLNAEIDERIVSKEGNTITPQMKELFKLLVRTHRYFIAHEKERFYPKHERLAALILAYSDYPIIESVLDPDYTHYPVLRSFLYGEDEYLEELY